MLGILVIILIILPLFFQIIFGRKAIGEDIKLTFWEVCLISFFSQFLLTLADLYLMVCMLQKDGITCGLPLAGLIMISLFFTIILIITIIIQYFIKKSYESKKQETPDRF
jgi:hypothetical protein